MNKAIVFDMDGVLFDTEKICDKAWHDIADKFNINNIEYLISNCRGKNAADTIKFIDENYRDKFSGEEAMDIFRKINKEIIEENGVPVKLGVYELLEYLKENSFKIALASSTRKDIVVKYLKEVGIFKFFDSIVTGDMIERGKPEPDIYLKACSRLGEDPKKCIAVEDSFNGIKSAYNAGMNVVMVPDLVQPTEEIKKIIYKKFDSLLDVKEFLEKNEVKL